MGIGFRYFIKTLDSHSASPPVNKHILGPPYVRYCDTVLATGRSEMVKSVGVWVGVNTLTDKILPCPMGIYSLMGNQPKCSTG